jgi:hypothetical protein
MFMSRRALAVLSLAGIALSIVFYLQSFSGTTADEKEGWIAVLVFGPITLELPMAMMEHAWRDRTFFWKGFARGMPGWVARCVKLFWLLAVAHLLWFGARTGFAIPIIKDGQYLLSNRGRIRAVISEPEYLALKAEELRMIAAFMIAVYLTPTMYWWFPQHGRQTT